MKTQHMCQVATFLIIVLLVCGRSFAVNPSDPCILAVTLSPPAGTFATFPGGGGSSQFFVNLGQSTCTWFLASSSFIHASPVSGGGGSQSQFTVNFSVDPNPDLATRQGFITVTQKEDNTSASYIVPQNAATGDFAIAAAPTSQSVAPVNGTSYNIAISRSGQFTGCVGLSVPAQPNGVGVSFSPNPACGTAATMNITTTGNACAGSFSIIISGQNGTVTHTYPVTLNIVGDFSLSVGSLSVVQGRSNSATVSINQLQGFSAPVTLSASGQPSGVSVNFTPNNTAGNSSTMTITALTSSPIGSFPLVVSGSSGCLTRTAPDTLRISPRWWPAIQQLLE